MKNSWMNNFGVVTRWVVSEVDSLMAMAEDREMTIFQYNLLVTVKDDYFWYVWHWCEC